MTGSAVLTKILNVLRHEFLIVLRMAGRAFLVRGAEFVICTVAFRTAQGGGIIIHLVPDQAELRLAVIKEVPGRESWVKLGSFMVAVTTAALVNLRDFPMGTALGRKSGRAHRHGIFHTTHPGLFLAGHGKVRSATSNSACERKPDRVIPAAVLSLSLPGLKAIPPDRKIINPKPASMIAVKINPSDESSGCCRLI